MKRRILTTAALVYLVAQNASAAPSFSAIGTEWLDELKKLFPIIVGISFIAMVLFNLGDLSGDNKNYKSFFFKVAIFCGGVAFVVVAYSSITSVKL